MTSNIVYTLHNTSYSTLSLWGALFIAKCFRWPLIYSRLSFHFGTISLISLSSNRLPTYLDKTLPPLNYTDAAHTHTHITQIYIAIFKAYDAALGAIIIQIFGDIDTPKIIDRQLLLWNPYLWQLSCKQRVLQGVCLCVHIVEYLVTAPPDNIEYCYTVKQIHHSGQEYVLYALCNTRHATV